jgi:UDP-N-acetyl-D-glucosamine/UDP-N-acetyl-D-galactosamine dehydrogenase
MPLSRNDDEPAMSLHQNLDSLHIGVVGLGYVGLPLAVALSAQFEVSGLDIDSMRIARLKQGIDDTGELDDNELKLLSRIRLTDRAEDLAACTVFIVAVPTPVHGTKLPDLSPLLAASAVIGALLKPNDVVIYESTVYPGAKEFACPSWNESPASSSTNRSSAAIHRNA